MLRIRHLTEADIPLGMRLKHQAGWNQVESDWRRFLNLEPAGCFVAEQDGAGVGTVTTCTFGAVAWIAMMLVDESQRGRGIGKSLMTHALDYLDRLGVEHIRLDATHPGRPLYEKLGFSVDYGVLRYEGTLPLGGAEPRVVSAEPEHLPELFRLDHAATAADRSELLRLLYYERPEEMRVVLQGGRPAGYFTARPGAKALHLGPCIATAEAGVCLFADVSHRCARQLVFIDIPEDNEPPNQMARSWGLGVQRSFVRMTRGPQALDNVQSLWASSGPEMG